MSVEILQKISSIISTGDSGVLCTIIASSGSAPRHTGTKMLVFPDGSFMGTVGGGEIENRVREEALVILKTKEAKVLKYSMVDPGRGDPGVCGGTVEVFVEPILPGDKVIVIGGGHVGKAVAHLAKWLGFIVAVSDDRPEFCTKEVNPDGDEFYSVLMSDLPNNVKIGPSTYLVLTTRGSNVDSEGLGSLLKTEATYIGVIGSKRRWELTKKALLSQGFTKETIERVFSPIGLELNAETPEEIAVSIMAEIIMLRNGGTGKTMKN